MTIKLIYVIIESSQKRGTEMTQTEKVFKATFNLVTGKTITIAVLAVNALDAGLDMCSVIHSEFNIPFGMIRLSNVRKSNRRILANMQESRKAKGWAWFS